MKSGTDPLLDRIGRSEIPNVLSAPFSLLFMDSKLESKRKKEVRERGRNELGAAEER